MFKGKKLIISRLFALIPILLSIASYATKVAINLGQMTMPIYLFPWLTTKSPFVFMIFVVVSLWIKNREKIFIAMGATKQEYNDFLKTNRNSFSFSAQLSLTIVGFVIIEVLVFLAIMIKYVFIEHLDFEVFFFSIVDAYEIGQTIPLLVCIPFVMLFSYTKTHKNKMIDIFIPVGGIAIIGFMYLEYFREFAIKLVEHAN